MAIDIELDNPIGAPIRFLWLPYRGSSFVYKSAEIAEDGGIVTTDHIHAYLHDEKIFSFSDAFALTSGNSRNFLVKTNSLEAHLFLGGQISDAAVIYIFDEPTVSVDGTEITGYNHVFGSAKTPTTQVFHTPTTTGDGTQKAREDYFAGKKIGSDIRQEDEIVVIANRYVLVRITASAGLNANIRLNIYEPGA
jgi:hypothetical protein